ncbi:hypothetical protein DYD21_15830 [Rhodohalobacter sp. SW132]|uniref:hypothetical protein n=1 Tax=Rhodohalobacter sp. SW132 TaxID=2293433 RepID=UPI000E249E05|nr:hypothetical protein [Rhodohalobacter sp. SW132]REL24989.1 hypothetical protein DYD21_15830 [Rhodohalobacter sp. SW132]
MIESNRNIELENRIEEYLDGKLSPQEVDELWAELIDNEYYLDYMKSVASLKQIGEERQKKSEEVRKEPVQRVWLSAAAAVVLMIGSAILFSLSTETSEMIKPVSTIELDYYRSADGMATESVESDVVRRAISTANTGEVGAALSLLNHELERANSEIEQAELLITSGSILYNSGQFSEAIERFENAKNLNYDDVMLRERNYWYLGNAYFQVNQIAEAKDMLEKAFEMNGAYSRVAQSYLRALSSR